MHKTALQVRDWEYAMHTNDPQTVLQCQLAAMPVFLETTGADNYAKQCALTAAHMYYLKTGQPHPLWLKVVSRDAALWDEEDHEIFFGIFTRLRSGNPYGHDLAVQNRAFLDVRNSSPALSRAMDLWYRRTPTHKAFGRGDKSQLAVSAERVEHIKGLLLRMIDEIEQGSFAFVSQIPTGAHSISVGHFATSNSNRIRFDTLLTTMAATQVVPIMQPTGTDTTTTYLSRLKASLQIWWRQSGKELPTTWRRVLLQVPTP